MSTASFDTTAAEAFGERMMDTLNAGALSLMISVGHRTGLFDTMAEMEPATSAEIAISCSSSGVGGA